MNRFENHDAVPILAILVFFVVVAIAIAFTHRAAKRRQLVVDEERDAAIKNGVARGTHNEFGEPLCVVCGQVATHPTVRTGRSWTDHIPILAGLNRLYAMPWRYAVVEDWQRGLRLCAAHRRAAEQRLEQAHASMRADHARFNADQQQKVAMLDQGGLEQLLKEDADVIRRSIGLRGGVRSTFDSSVKPDEVEAVHVLPVRSTDSPEPESDEHA